MNILLAMSRLLNSYDKGLWYFMLLHECLYFSHLTCEDHQFYTGLPYSCHCRNDCSLPKFLLTVFQLGSNEFFEFSKPHSGPMLECPQVLLASETQFVHLCVSLLGSMFKGVWSYYQVFYISQIRHNGKETCVPRNVSALFMLSCTYLSVCLPTQLPTFLPSIYSSIHICLS